MSVVNKIGNLFNRKSDAPQTDAGPASDQDLLALDELRPYQADALNSVQGDPDAPASELPSADSEADLIVLPVLGQATAAAHQRRLLMLLALGVVLLALIAGWVLQQADRTAQQLAATGQSLMQSQRLAKSVSQALVGSPQAFPDVVESSGVLARNVRALNSGDNELGVQSLGEPYKPELEAVTPLMERAERNAAVVMGQQKILTQVGDALRTINRQSSDLLEIAETISSLKLQQNASASEISAAGQLVMLTQRIGKSANEFQTSEGVSPEAVFLLGKDLNSFKEIAQGLLDGSPELRLAATKDAQTREQLAALIKLYEDTRNQAGAILGNLQGLVSAREAQTAIIGDSEPLRRQLETLQNKLSAQTGVGAGQLGALVLAGMFVLLCGVGISRVQLLDSRHRQQMAEMQQRDARRQEQEAKRINDANQAAILRLMNELQQVAEGDLTQEATVTEDITGAIADSVNYTVEELRQLVGSVQKTATRVAQTTAMVDNTSTELLAASTEQLREIRETGQSVLDMAGRINDVSVQAEESAQVARQSLQAADSGLQAVQNAIGGMNSIRDQIQETSKRIKRLGESSQEIGEITELISDITEQTNVLALNAAIQAASAGEAGRGFSVVAEEVQRLAERSADATRQISALVKAIQTDTQDAVAAMERSTQGVVEGARLSDSAGTALTEIDRVSRRLADLIEQISSSTSREASLANEVADNIQHIFAVTEQTGEGTRATAQQVRELSTMAEELRQSVSRFKIA
ncbi:MAG: type IV pili methyl-accepting chemotaxis transducer N-terminal domain-containing protein [Burkholderiales bacterium]|jgi:twitching motility protein PilJ|nr:type IV pili methyl-accepting chemotaxis transducer N-terminal domain-containing protein [Burkholderiales bacterium]